MNSPTVGGKFAAKDVGGGGPDAPGGVKTPPYDAKDKGDTMARLRAGHARPLRTTVNGSRTKGAHWWLPLPFSPTKTKKRDGHCPVSFSLKRRRKTERLAGACIEWKPPLYKWMPFLGNREGALVFFLFYLLGKLCSASSALCFRCLNITLFLSRLQDADLYNLQ